MGQAASPTKTATFGAGCFWGVEKVFMEIPGVLSTSVGYMGGKTHNPSYQQVCTDDTGHAEVVQVVYDPGQVSYAQLLIIFWEWHDPTTLNRQGPDVGSQYRSIIFTEDEEQMALARRSQQILQKSGIFPKPIVTEITPAQAYYPAESYHQKYLVKNPKGYCSHVLASPKIREILTAELLQRHP